MYNPIEMTSDDQLETTSDISLRAMATTVGVSHYTIDFPLQILGLSCTSSNQSILGDHQLHLPDN